MKIESVYDRSFKPYGQVLTGYDTSVLIQALAREYLLPVFLALEDMIRSLPLVAVYVYRQKNQPPGLLTTDGTPMRSVDGVAWVDVTPDRGKLNTIGLSCEALRQGPEYFRFLFLHEFAHVIFGGKHSRTFHQQLDRLIEQFNQETGSRIVNAYCQ